MKRPLAKCSIFGQVNVSVDWAENIGTAGQDDDAFA